MLRIRLRRTGKKRHHTFRVVVADKRAKRDGAFLETLGAYNPHAEPPSVELNEERAREWLSKGAQPSEAVEKIFRRAGIIEGGPVQVKRGETKAEDVPAPAAVAEAPTEEPAKEAPAAEEPAAEAESPEAESPAAEAPAKAEETTAEAEKE